MGQGVDRITKMYDGVAKAYFEAFSGEHEKKPKDREMLTRFLKRVAGRTPVWDVGCGPGQTVKYLKNLGVDISGMDLSGKMIEQARVANPGTEFRKGDILDLEFGDDSIAGILSFYTIVHFTKEQVAVALGEVYRVLEPGGLFLFTYHKGECNIHVESFLGKRVDVELVLFDTRFICRCLMDKGFEIIDVVSRDVYPGVEYPTQREYVFAGKPLADSLPQ